MVTQLPGEMLTGQMALRLSRLGSATRDSQRFQQASRSMGQWRLKVGNGHSGAKAEAEAQGSGSFFPPC